MVALIGPLAMIDGEFRQARKGATVTVDSCAGMWLVRVATQSYHSKLSSALPIEFICFISIFSLLDTLLIVLGFVYNAAMKKEILL